MEEDNQRAVFVRKARQIAHQALYWLYHVAPRTQVIDAALAEDRQVVLEQVRSLVNGVHLTRPAADHARALPPDAVAITPGPEPGATGLLGWFFEHAPERDDSPALAVEYWATRLWRPINAKRSEPLTASEVAVLIARFQRFLTLTRADSGRGAIDRALTKTRRALGRNLALITGLILTWIVYRNVPAVHNLMFNMPWRTVVPPFVVVALGGVGIAFLHLSPRLGIGIAAFWRTAYQALPPEPGTDLALQAKAVSSLIVRDELTKYGVLLVWLVSAGSAYIGAAMHGRVDRTQQTLFLLNAVFLHVLVFLHWFDRWDFVDGRRVRLNALLLAAVLLAASMSRYWAIAQPPLALLFFGLACLWAVRAYQRRPLQWGWCIAAAGSLAVALMLLGSRHTRERSIWGTALHGHVGEHLQQVGKHPQPVPGDERWPHGGPDGLPVVLMAASGGGSRAAVYTAYVLERLHQQLPEVARNLQAISSVSGSSLTSAAYIARRMRGKRAPHEASFWPDEPDDLGADCSRAGDGLRDGELVKAAAQDFLLPTLRGALLPLLSRGEAIEASFMHDVGLGSIRIGDVASAWQAHAGAYPPFPVPLFNACTLDAHAVVISPLERAYYRPSEKRNAARAQSFAKLRSWYSLADVDPLTWVLDRDEVLAFEDLNSSYSPSLAEAVRASANFPFGFPLVEVSTESEYGVPYRTPGENSVKLTDGGVLSNSGLWTLFHLMTNESTSANELKRRGVLLLVVDASHMPEYADNRRDLVTLYGAIADQAPVAQNLHRRMLEYLGATYGNKLSVVQIDIPPTLEDNVLTTWALDEASRRKLRRSFCRVWFPGKAGSASLQKAIADRWERLKNPQGAQAVADAAPLGPALVRYPLD